MGIKKLFGLNDLDLNDKKKLWKNIIIFFCFIYIVIHGFISAIIPLSVDGKRIIMNKKGKNYYYVPGYLWNYIH